jgi:hypothetical protein
MYLRCDECLKEFFSDGSPVTTRFELHMRIKTLEDKLKHKEGEISLMKTKLDMLCSNLSLIENKLDEVYFAPDMPGYIYSKQNFDNVALE